MATREQCEGEIEAGLRKTVLDLCELIGCSPEVHPELVARVAVWMRRHAELTGPPEASGDTALLEDVYWRLYVDIKLLPGRTTANVPRAIVPQGLVRQFRSMFNPVWRQLPDTVRVSLTSFWGDRHVFFVSPDCLMTGGVEGKQIGTGLCNADGVIKIPAIMMMIPEHTAHTIAHEIAHAYFRSGGIDQGVSPEGNDLEERWVEWTMKSWGFEKAADAADD